MKAQLRSLGLGGAFIAVTTLFFGWGFVASNNDPLIMAMRSAFGLNYTAALAIQLVSFAANGLVSFPAAALGNRVGPVNAIVLALAAMIAGCLSVRLALQLGWFPAVLAALFVLAAGITTLQVSANPLAASLGPARSSHFRLSLAQAFNSLGVVAGVNYGAAVMLGGADLAGAAQGAPGAAAGVFAAVDRAFAAMAAMLAVLALFVWMQRRRIAAAAAHSTAPSRGSPMRAALRAPVARAGAVAIALYVGAEVSIGSIMIAFLHRSDVLGLPLRTGGFYLAELYWGGALAGRMAGSLLLTRVRPAHLLRACAAAAAVLCLIAFAGVGALSGYAALTVGLFNSIMFPTIFTLTLERSEAPPAATSALLVLAISFGGVIPLLVARVADLVGLAAAFAVPALAYLAIAAFAARQPRLVSPQAVDAATGVRAG